MNILEGIRTVDQLDVENKRVFVRVDFNVPMEDGRITDDTRIREALSTIEALRAKGAKVVLGSHLGRPKPGKRDGLSLVPVGERLAELAGVEVHVPDDCVGKTAQKVIFDLRPGQICLLENLRFHEEEEKNDEAFARELAALADAYVCDAFGALHRAHASVHALPRMFRERAAGHLVMKEISSLGRLLESREHPYVAVLGGAKVSDKITVIEALLERCDAILIGGAMANTFLAAKGLNMQKSLVETEKLPLARTLIDKAAARRVELLLPTDFIVGASIKATEGQVVAANAVPEGTMALDIGPDSVAAFAAKTKDAALVFWNGPMGLFEQPAFSSGTFGLAKALTECTGFTVVGGGDSAAAVQAAGGDIASKFGHISTGGGASLELIEGKKLPGIEALRP